MASEGARSTAPPLPSVLAVLGKEPKSVIQRQKLTDLIKAVDSDGVAARGRVANAA